MRGEFGVIVKAVNASRAKDARCHLYITYDGEPYVGTLGFDNAAFCRFIVAFLKKHIGERIEDIASLEVPERL